MIVTSLKYSNNGSEVDLFLDDNFSCRLLIDTIAAFKLFVNKSIEECDIQDIVSSDIGSRLFKKGINYITIRPHSIREVRSYLNKSQQKLFNKKMFNIALDDGEELINKTIDRLVELKYLDDAQFSKWMIESRISTGKKSRKEAVSELIQKGISIYDAQECIKKFYTGEDELLMIKKIIQKKFPDVELIIKDRKRKEKMIGYFLRRGFSYDLIKETIS
jgi:regulatory protein